MLRLPVPGASAGVSGRTAARSAAGGRVWARRRRTARRLDSAAALARHALPQLTCPSHRAQRDPQRGEAVSDGRWAQPRP